MPSVGATVMSFSGGLLSSGAASAAHTALARGSGLSLGGRLLQVQGPAAYGMSDWRAAVAHGWPLSDEGQRAGCTAESKGVRAPHAAACGGRASALLKTRECCAYESRRRTGCSDFVVKVHDAHLHKVGARACKPHGSTCMQGAWKHARARRMGACACKAHGSMCVQGAWEHVRARRMGACACKPHGIMCVQGAWEHVRARRMGACACKAHGSMRMQGGCSSVRPSVRPPVRPPAHQSTHPRIRPDLHKNLSRTALE
eukprot:353690-Chlamydomonas_euryale.AAC.1